MTLQRPVSQPPRSDASRRHGSRQRESQRYDSPEGGRRRRDRRKHGGPQWGNRQSDNGTLGRWLAACIGVLLLIDLLVAARSSWAAQVVLVPLLLVFPGVLLLRAVRVPGLAVASFPVYIPCASVAVLLGSGLAVDLIGPLTGVTQPLRAGPLLVSFDLICLALLAASAKAPPETAIYSRSLQRPARLAWPLAVPLLAAAGALRLNSGHGSSVALLAIVACVVLLVAAVSRSGALDRTMLAVVLYAAALAVTWSYSLRSDLVNGFDIATEYQRMEHVLTLGLWHASNRGDAYGAMLSVTVLPAELHALSGLPGLLVFKLIYPAIYALFPVAVFSLARRILPRRWAFTAAAFTIVQYYFPELAAFARQEVALAFFAALIGAMLEPRIKRRTQSALVVIFALGLAVSHYSTTYLTIVIIGLMLPLQFALSYLWEFPRMTGSILTTFIAALAGALLWYGPITHSASHLGQFLQIMQAQGLNILPNRLPGQNLLAAYLRGNIKIPIASPEYAQLVHGFYLRTRPYISPLPDASSPLYALHNYPVPKVPVRFALGSSGLNIALLVIVQLANLLSAVGAIVLVLRRNAPVLARQVGMFALAALLFLTLIRLSGTLAAAYNQERALLQSLMFLAITLCWPLQALTNRHVRHRAKIFAVITACVAVVFASTSYLANAVLGGGTSDNLANSGPDYEYFYETTPELASARWLGEKVTPGQFVYADEYAQLPLEAMTWMKTGLFFDVTPLTLNRHAWVYADQTNVVSKRAFGLYGLKLASFVFPSRFLDSHYNVVYTDGSSKVYHR